MKTTWNDGAPFDNFLENADAPAIARRHICNFGGSGATEKKTQETSLPGWVSAAGQDNYQRAGAVADNLMGPYQGQRVADLTEGQKSNIAAGQANVGSTNGAFQQAQGTTQNFLNYNAPQVSAGQLSNTNLDPYMNPFTNQVIQGGLSALDIQRQQSINQGAAQASQARAFGGSRQGVMEGITNAGSAAQAGQLYAGLQSQNFMQAQNAATGDIGRRYAADVANQNASMQGAGIQLGAANQMGQLATGQQQNFLAGLAGAQDLQNQQQMNAQQKLDAQRALYEETRNMPLQQLQIRQGALTNTPYGNTVTSTQPGAADNSGMQAAGLGIAAAGTVAMFM